MFFYLSFLRPPPTQSPLSPISITPQIANDLRTELYTNPQDIFYAWSPCSSPSSLPTFNKSSRPTKLTTWRHANAYKAISVPPPPGVREGQYWRLILCANALPILSPPHIIPLFQGVSKGPLPVISMPILFSSRGYQGGAGKQEQVERIYRMSIPPSGEIGDMVVREQTSFDLDKKVWDSGVGLSAWLVDLYGNNIRLEVGGLVGRLKAVLDANERRHILELGAGTGIVSITLGALLSSLEIIPSQQQRIITTDLESAMPFLEHNLKANAHLFASPSSSLPEPLVLDWDDEKLPIEVASITGGFDVIIMADVTYNTSSFPSLIQTLSHLINLNPNPPLILLGYKERDISERTLWDMAEESGVVFEKVAEKDGAGGKSVEVWIGTVKNRVDC
ncbi:hypothetical protein JAAARDRAFT_199686 [Jaapia argillacea MUCL 33604]|uniref:Methyltransferase-domain-containing protein n=1 Tax=Jaapia argillacea MUCL 33604 TaxID=933084 RepID=A0A067PI30_9AGAM|nr:hypothetical protein JAAARDRAFT_199686 [Jaapia argillacea MUCL 33604]